MPFRHPAATRELAVLLVADGLRPRQVAARLAVDASTVYAWLKDDAPHLVAQPGQRCWRCGPDLTADRAAYAQLLGLYLGDGWLTTMPSGACALSVACDDAWPGLAQECDDVMRKVLATSVCHVRRRGCHDVKAYSRHWLCLFPQHGPGKKQDRPIVLEDWQQAVVDAHPGHPLRGLFHSDGWRGHNVAVHRAADGFVTRYRYSRYEFTNKSADIRGICTEALDALGIAWRPNGPWRVSVNRRDAVAALDEHVGPKY